MKTGFLDKLIERLDKLDSQSLQTQFLRLIKEKGLLEAVFNAIYEGIIVLDPEGKINYANNAAASLLGFSVDSARGESLSRYFREINWGQILELDTKEWSKLISHEIEITYPEHKYLNVYIMPISLSLGENDNKGAVVMFRDITGEREKEQSEVESKRMHAITLLAAGVAHEIGNPLNSLHIHLQLIKRELNKLEDEQKQPLEELLNVAGDEVNRLNLIITQFLRAIRPSLPKRKLCQIETILKESIDFMKRDIKNREIIVDIKKKQELPKIAVDPTQIKQAFFNIIKNAMQAMPRGGILTISLATTGNAVAISFKDIGEGIPAEELGRIFQPFSTTKSDGSGLGLMIVQRIIQDHGGQIEVNTQQGKGTTFTILLPIKEQRIRLLKAPKKDSPETEEKENE